MTINIQLLLKALAVEKIILYGNRSKTAKDIDLLIVSNDFKPVFRSKRKAIVKKWITADRPVDPICLTCHEYAQLLKCDDAYRHNIIEKGEVLYDKSCIK